LGPGAFDDVDDARPSAPPRRGRKRGPPGGMPF
jgi:hypothetical protein